MVSTRKGVPPLADHECLRVVESFLFQEQLDCSVKNRISSKPLMPSNVSVGLPAAR